MNINYYDDSISDDHDLYDEWWESKNTKALRISSCKVLLISFDRIVNRILLERE